MDLGTARWTELLQPQVHGTQDIFQRGTKILCTVQLWVQLSGPPDYGPTSLEICAPRNTKDYVTSGIAEYMYNIHTKSIPYICSLVELVINTPHFICQHFSLHPICHYVYTSCLSSDKYLSLIVCYISYLNIDQCCCLQMPEQRVSGTRILCTL
jgi:hypothetical protein